MMKTTKINSILLCFCLLIFSSCQNDDDFVNGGSQENIPNAFSEYFGSEISRDFLGKVIDKNHNPIEGVNISIGAETATTDSNGVFIIRDASLGKRFGYLKAEKVGYISGSRSVVPSSGTNKVTIMLLEANATGTVNSGNAETVTAPDGSSVSFDGNFIKEDGTAYEGAVNVIMHHLDPADEDMPLQMPGMLYAENEEGAERMLQTYGMLAVELIGSGGEDLNLAEGSTSEIKIPLDPSLMGTAPATIPLWYFDEENGYWKEEGQATLQGSMYVGTVSHFSFWNCDIPARAISLCVTVSGDAGNLLNNLYVNIISSDFGSRGGWTNQNGEVCGLVPRDENLVLSIEPPLNCNGLTQPFTLDIGPFSSDSSLSVELPTVLGETITGNFNTCNGDLVSNGYVELNHAGQTYIDDVTSGNFEFSILRCENDNDFSIRGVDYDNIQETGEVTYLFTSPTTDIGNLVACNSLGGEFFIFTDDITGDVYIFEDVNAYAEFSNYLTIEANVGGFNTNCVTLNFDINGPNNVVGNYTLGQEDQFGWFGCGSLTTSDYYLQYHDINISAFGGIGEYINISFSGFYTLDDVQEDLTPMTGTISVLRDL